MTLIERLKAGGLFDPSPELVRACEMSLVAKAHVETLMPTVMGYQRAILEADEHLMCERMWELRRENGVPEESRRIFDPDSSYLLADEDAERYFAACKKAAKAAGLVVSKPDNCPLLEAQHLVIEAENHLLKVFADEMGEPNFADPVLLKTRDKLLEIIYKLVTPRMDDADQVLRRWVA